MRVEKEVYLSNIKMDRIPLSEKTYNYATLMKEGVVFPPIKLARRRDGEFEIRDGRHRWTARKLLGYKKILSKFSKKFLKKE